MKLGIARINAGVRKKYPPADGGSPVIEKGREYLLPDDYDFSHKEAIFKPVKEDKTSENPIQKQRRNK